MIAGAGVWEMRANNLPMGGPWHCCVSLFAGVNKSGARRTRSNLASGASVTRVRVTSFRSFRWCSRPISEEELGRSRGAASTARPRGALQSAKVCEEYSGVDNRLIRTFNQFQVAWLSGRSSAGINWREAICMLQKSMLQLSSNILRGHPVSRSLTPSVTVQTESDMLLSASFDRVQSCVLRQLHHLLLSA
jgi:hypothetical protein